jgi:oligopeptidase B
VAPTPPVAPRRPVVLAQHGDERVDDWYWLRERDNPAVRDYLEAENAYTDAVLAPTKPLRDRIFEEIRSRIEETDTTALVPDGPWEYYTRTFEGKQYAVHCRRPRGAPNFDDEQMLLDENAEAEGHQYFSLGGFEVTPDHRILAFAEDTTGGERHNLRFRDLGSGADCDDLVENVTYGLAWADDQRTCFYVRPDDAMRPWQVWRHTLGSPASNDVLVFQEDDDRFYVGVHRTRSGRYILIDTSSKTSSEVWFIPTDVAGAPPRVVTPRAPGHEYSVEHQHDGERLDHFLIVTNTDGAQNFKLVSAPTSAPHQANWSQLVPPREDVRLEHVDAFRSHLVLTERHEGLIRLRVQSVIGDHAHDKETTAKRPEESGALSRPMDIAVPDPVYTLWVGPNEEFGTNTLRYGYTSLVAPVTDVDYDLATHEAEVVKVQPVRGGYDAAAYTSTRMWVEQADGVRVPMSIVHRKDVPLDGGAPALLYGYGSYEISIDAAFRASRLALLDRGFVYAIAHVRGGGELGRPWYENGRLEHKRNTFTDFIGCAEALVTAGYTSPARLVARGGSAGGLLMGAIANLRPDLFTAIIAEVPFVDVLTTMLDPSLPLTITEWEEWGDPREGQAYEWMKQYSPYDNVQAQPYPAMLVTTGLNDPRVQYWEPAKWVAKLRAHSTSGSTIILRTELDSGHGGPSGRYDAWREEALILAFACSSVGITN